jgi:Nitroreductase family
LGCARRWAASEQEVDATRIGVLILLSERFSIGPRHLTLPAPSPEQLRCAAQIAARAPDHGRLHPFRFVRVGATQREHLSQLFASAALRRGCDMASAEHAAAKAHNGPALIGVVAHTRAGVEGVPVHEQWMTIGGGLMNFLNALHVMGFGAKVLSGPLIGDEGIQQSFCRSGEQLVAWVLAGTPSARRSEDNRSGADGLRLSEWGE